MRSQEMASRALQGTMGQAYRIFDVSLDQIFYRNRLDVRVEIPQ